MNSATNSLHHARKGFNTSALDALRRRVRRYSAYRETVRELSCLDDRALADLGLSRAMIKPLAREVAGKV